MLFDRPPIRTQQFPGVGFVPGIDNEFLYFLNNHLAEGGPVGYAAGGRVVRGPGGPKDDAIPAVVVDQAGAHHPARLSDGEFVFPVEAVVGIGEGDPAVGAQRLQELADRLSRRAR